ncbi:MAG: response regulator [Gammaproteobacteria bacterium]|jgi:HD-like signal output (HDOD) protein/CheY-like chemotaxis protein
MSDRKKILFVDDDQSLLDGLHRALHSERKQWEMYFVPSGEEAVALMAQHRFDALITDIRMPGMDGVQLLSEVKRQHPDLIRFILSGHSSDELTLQSVKSAHQFFSKPCDIESLKAALVRAFSLRELLSNTKLQTFVSGTIVLPSLPHIYTEIVEHLDSPDVSVRAVGGIIAKDPGITAKILQLVNSAFFGLGRKVSNPEEAASLLGMDTIKCLVLSVGLFSQFNTSRLNQMGFSLEEAVDHSIRVGLLAQQIAKSENASKQMLDESHLSGFLHDIGRLILAENMPQDYARVMELARQDGYDLFLAEREILGTDHAAVGAYLLGLWGFADTVIETVAFHHRPELSGSKAFGPLTAVYVANALENTKSEQFTKLVSIEYLQSLGLDGRLEAWETLYAAAGYE